MKKILSAKKPGFRNTTLTLTFLAIVLCLGAPIQASFFSAPAIRMD
jgi:hypothetical protein